MIYTVTFNPAIDYVIHTDKVELGSVNRVSKEAMFFGGKGINVSAILKELDVESVALGFVAGFTGEAIEKGVENMGIKTGFCHLKNGNSRINVKLKEYNIKGNIKDNSVCDDLENERIGQETEINGQGPKIDNESVEELLCKLDGLQDDDILILAGSVPGSMPSNIYEIIINRISTKRIKIVVDATRDLLLKVLPYKPFLIKPNNFELGEIFNVNLDGKNVDEIFFYAKKLQDMSAKNVLVSMAGDGALLLDENGDTHKCGVCKGVVKNSVGAGDSMVAGFVAGFLDGDYEYALKLGTACGGATAFAHGLGKKEDIYKLLQQL